MLAVLLAGQKDEHVVLQVGIPPQLVQYPAGPLLDLFGLHSVERHVIGADDSIARH